MEELAKEIPEKVYALDDNTALKVIDGKIEAISEGEWFTTDKNYLKKIIIKKN